MCVHVRAVCSEFMNEVIDNAKNNFGDLWTPNIFEDYGIKNTELEWFKNYCTDRNTWNSTT